MIKVMTFIKRKEGLSKEEFIQYYEGRHVPLSDKHLPRPKRYSRSYISKTFEGQEPEFDVVTQNWFEDAESAQAINDVLGGSDIESGYTSEIGRIFAEDEERFMDRTARFSCVIDERFNEY